MPSNIEVDKPNYFMRKSQFGYKNRAHDFEDATFAWLLKRGLVSRENNPSAHRETVLDNISVHVWDEHDKPTNPQLELEFPPTREGMTVARSYARQILEAGALLASVDVRVTMPWKAGQLVESTTFTNKTAL
jgi:hypothetical protein